MDYTKNNVIVYLINDGHVKAKAINDPSEWCRLKKINGVVNHSIDQ